MEQEEHAKAHVQDDMKETKSKSRLHGLGHMLTRFRELCKPTCSFLHGMLVASGISLVLSFSYRQSHTGGKSFERYELSYWSCV